MTPKEYLDRYTYMKFQSPSDSMQTLAGIRNYGSGWGSRLGTCKPAGTIQREYQLFVRALRTFHHGNPNTPCGPVFSLQGACNISSREQFYSKSLLNTFVGKGSPDEITDTLRLGMLIGRFGMTRDVAGQPAAAPNAQAYATGYITLDCNGLVGNYYGGNSDASIDAYTSGQKRNKITDVRPGDVVITHCEKFPFEHVGLIQEWNVSGEAAAVRIVEWGWYGGEEAHFSPKPVTHKIQQGPDKRFGIGWSTPSPKDSSGKTMTFRYVFGPPAGARDPHGWP
jgi:hypothetical protein